MNSDGTESTYDKLKRALEEAIKRGLPSFVWSGKAAEIVLEEFYVKERKQKS